MVQDKPLKRDLKNSVPVFQLLGGEICLKYKKILIPSFSPLHRFLKHPGFRIGQSFQNCSRWEAPGVSTFSNLIVNSQVQDFNYFSEKIDQLDWLQYCQLRSLVLTLLRKDILRVSLTKFENVLISRSIHKKSWSKIYSLLTDNGKLDLGPCHHWAKDLQYPISEAEWIKTSKYILDISFNIAIWETYYKGRNQWYLTLNRMFWMYPNSDSLYWRCHREIGNMVHIGWLCPNIFKFWSEVYQEITPRFNLSLTPESCLLHLNLKIGKFDKILLNNLIVAAILLIAKNWKSIVPTL